MAKTEHRREWEKSLPERHKVLRLQIQVLKASIKRDKEAMKYVYDDGDKAFFKRSVNAQNVVIRALRNELGYNRVPKAVWPSFEVACQWCGQGVEFGDKYCTRCGRELNWLDVIVGVHQGMVEDAENYLTRGHAEFMRKFQKVRKALETQEHEDEI